MTIEYCDKCKRKLPKEGRKKRIVQMSYQTGHGSLATAKVTLCEKCFSEMGIADTVNRIGPAPMEEKDPDAVERLMDIFRELVTECIGEMEEQGCRS